MRVNAGIVDPNLTQGVMTKGYNAYIDRGNALANQERANKLADLQYNQAMDAETQRRALQSYYANKNPNDPDFEQGLGMIVGPQGVMDYRTKKAAAGKAEFEFRAKKDDFLNQFKRNASADPSGANLAKWRDIAVREGFYSAEEADDTVEQLLQMPVEERVRVLSQAGASPGELKPSTIQINRNGQTDVAQVAAFGGAPRTVGTYADVAPPQDVIDARARVAAAGRPEGAKIYIPPQASEEQKARGGMLVKQYGAVSDQAGIAVKTLPAIQDNLKILENGFNTGFGTEAQAAGAKVLGALGVKDAEKYATNAQIFNANATQAVLQRQLEQKGPQTESDAQRIKETGAQLGNTAGGNKFMLTVAQEQLKRDIEQRSFYDKWWKANKTYDGAEDAWYEGDGGKSLFDRPALKDFGKQADKRKPLDQIFGGKKNG